MFFLGHAVEQTIYDARAAVAINTPRPNLPFSPVATHVHAPTLRALPAPTKGLDTALVVKPIYSMNFFKAFEVMEIVAKPACRVTKLPNTNTNTGKATSTSIIADTKHGDDPPQLSLLLNRYFTCHHRS